jgi:hypothetical protein
VVIIEWIWHGWPEEMTVFLTLYVTSWLGFSVSSFIVSRLTGEGFLEFSAGEKDTDPSITTNGRAGIRAKASEPLLDRPPMETDEKGGRSYLDSITGPIEVTYATFLVSNAIMSAEGYQEQLDNVELTQVLREYLYLYLYVTGLVADKHLNPNESRSLKEMLLGISIEGLFNQVHSKWDPDLVKYLKEESLEQYWERDREYQRYKFVQTDREGSTKGTLSWEFGKRVARIATPDDMPINPGEIIGAQGIALAGLKNLSPKEFIERVVRQMG